MSLSHDDSEGERGPQIVTWMRDFDPEYADQMLVDKQRWGDGAFIRTSVIVENER